MSTGMVNLVELERKAKRQEKLLSEWLATAIAVVQSEVADATAHAAKAVTSRLLETADGRPSVLRVTKSPSYKAAEGHLWTMARRLAGSGSRSTKGLLREARVAFYRESRKVYAGMVPEGMARSDEPTKKEVSWLKGFPMHGVDLAVGLADAVRSTASALKAVIEVSARKEEISRDEDLRLETWRKQTEVRFVTLAKIALSDGQMFADRVSSRDAIRDGYREEVIWED